MGLERITRVKLPFDMRSEDPRNNYGIHATDIFFILKGPKGAVQYAVTLPCYLPHVKKELERKDPSYYGLYEIRGFDVGYHSKRPMYEDHKPMESCDLFPGEKCYYDGSSLAADRWTDLIFTTIGRPPEQIVWQLLEREYEERFGKDEGGR